MNPSPNYIHFRVQWQILGPESPGQRFERKTFQDFFDRLNDVREFSGYDDFSYRPDRCELVKARGSVPKEGQAFSKVVYANDALVVVEEWSDHSVAEFTRKIKIVLDRWFSCFPQTLAVMQSCWIRALVAPIHFDDSRRFLGDAVLQLSSVFKEKLTVMPHNVGFTFACQRESDNVPMNFDCKVCSWRDNRSVWIEVHGAAVLRQPLNAARHDATESIFERCRLFLDQEVTQILNKHDQSTNDPSAGAS